MNKIINGDCIEELKKFPENSVDAIITDPPYGLGFMGKEWDTFKPDYIEEHKQQLKKQLKTKPRTDGRKVPTTGLSMRAGQYDFSVKGLIGFQKWFQEASKECLRVLKPGGFLLSFGGTRTYHRLVCGIEDAGFEIRDTIMWLYGSGFPKSLNIGKQIDKIQGNERDVVGEKIRGDVQKAKEKGVGYLSDPANRNNTKQFGYGKEELTKGNSEWEGWGTALKPACEPIVVARKPLSEKNIALNVLKHGTGGINIDACRISLNGEQQPTGSAKRVYKNNQYTDDKSYGDNKITPEQGRFPANIILDEEAGRMLDEQSGLLVSGKMKAGTHRRNTDYCKGITGLSHTIENNTIGDKGGASRFFYCAKASKSERNLGCEDIEPQQQDESRKEGNPCGDNPRNRGVHKRANNHPTVKPIKLMEYLVKLVSKEGAVILDPFAGSGTTLIACAKLGRKGIGIEKEAEYVKIAEARIKKYLKQTKLSEVK